MSWEVARRTRWPYPPGDHSPNPVDDDSDSYLALHAKYIQTGDPVTLIKMLDLVRI